MVSPSAVVFALAQHRHMPGALRMKNDDISSILSFVLAAWPGR
jgi:hypothetical protein